MVDKRAHCLDKVALGCRCFAAYNYLQRLRVHQRDSLLAMIVTETLQNGAAVFLCALRNASERAGLVVTDQGCIDGAGDGSARANLWRFPILLHGAFSRFHELRRPR